MTPWHRRSVILFGLCGVPWLAAGVLWAQPPAGDMQQQPLRGNQGGVWPYPSASPGNRDNSRPEHNVIGTPIWSGYNGSNSLPPPPSPQQQGGEPYYLPPPLPPAQQPLQGQGYSNQLPQQQPMTAVPYYYGGSPQPAAVPYQNYRGGYYVPAEPAAIPSMNEPMIPSEPMRPSPGMAYPNAVYPTMQPVQPAGRYIPPSGGGYGTAMPSVPVMSPPAPQFPVERMAPPVENPWSQNTDGSRYRPIGGMMGGEKGGDTALPGRRPE
ncbi:MAG: hypothetical protein HQL58_00685 [Magnetococcales bacterium]|nr:hypothetical protein [Magnetococcales bacterium]